MTIKSLRCCDYLDWLKGQKDFLQYQIELAEETGNQRDVIELTEELQMVHEIEGIVAKWEDKNVC